MPLAVVAVVLRMEPPRDAMAVLVVVALSQAVRVEQAHPSKGLLAALVRRQAATVAVVVVLGL